MRRSIASTFAVVLCTALLVIGLPGRAWADEDVCAKPQGTLDDFLLSFSMNLNREELADEAASRPSSDGLSAGGRLDLLRRAFVALGLGQVTDEEGQLVFNFNPDALHFDSFGQFSPRIVVHQPAIYGALDEHIDGLDEELRAPARDQLKKDLGDLDDVEYSVRWTSKLAEPANVLDDIASKLMDAAVAERLQAAPQASTTGKTEQTEQQTLAKKISIVKAAIGKILNSDDPFGRFQMKDICAKPDAKAQLNEIVQLLRTDIPLANAELDKALEGRGFNRLADLIEGNPRLVINGTYRQRSGATGPNETSVDATFQWGWVSYRGAKHFAQQRSDKKEQKTADINVDSLNEYFKKYGRLEGAAPLFSLVASYAKTNAFLIPVPGATDPFSQDAGHKLSIKGTAAGYFGGGRDRKLELTAAYDKVSDDEVLQDGRFVANLTWVETLGEEIAKAVGGSEFVVTLVWANKPEFRGEVDKDFGLHAGLKWSLGNGKKN